MDISKLPRLSETDKHAPPPPSPADAGPQGAEVRPQPMYYETTPAAAGPEAWISIAIGIILILMSPRIWQFFGSKLFGTAFTWTFTDTDGSPLAYTRSVYFWGDLAMAAFAVVLVVEGVVLAFARRRPFVALAFALTVTATLLNLAYLVWMMWLGYGLQIMAALAVAFGIYIAVYQKRLLAQPREGPALS